MTANYGEKALRSTLSPKRPAFVYAASASAAKSHSPLWILTSSRMDVIRRERVIRPLAERRLKLGDAAAFYIGHRIAGALAYVALAGQVALVGASPTPRRFYSSPTWRRIDTESE